MQKFLGMAQTGNGKHGSIWARPGPQQIFCTGLRGYATPEFSRDVKEISRELRRSTVRSWHRILTVRYEYVHGEKNRVSSTRSPFRGSRETGSMLQ